MRLPDRGHPPPLTLPMPSPPPLSPLQGYVLNSTIDGCIQMKSYLSGNPGLRLALNEDLIVGKENAGGYAAGVVLDDCNFHECVNLDDFAGTRTLALIPPDGEFVLMNYRMTSEFRAPFRVFPILEETSPYKVELVLKVRAPGPEGEDAAASGGGGGEV